MAQQDIYQSVQSQQSPIKYAATLESDLENNL